MGHDHSPFSRDFPGDFPGDFPPGHPVAGLQGGPVRRAVSPPRTDVKNDGHETNN